MDALAVIGGLASLASIASFAPQAWKIIRTRDTRSISTGMYVLTVTGFALWSAYGIVSGQWPIVLTNTLCLLLAAFILAMKLRRGRV